MNLDVNAAGGDAKAVSKSKSKQIAGNGFKAKNFIEVFRVHLQVRKGDYLGLNSSKTGSGAMLVGKHPAAALLAAARARWRVSPQRFRRKLHADDPGDRPHHLRRT